MTKILTPEQQGKARERRKRYNERVKAKIAAAANDPTPPNFSHAEKGPSKAEIESRKIHFGGTSLLDDPSASTEDFGAVEELHPCAIAVCLSCFFAMAYRETPPAMPRSMLYDGTLFSAADNRATREIVLSVKKDAWNNHAPTVERRFPVEAFRRLYIEA